MFNLITPGWIEAAIDKSCFAMVSLHSRYSAFCLLIHFQQGDLILPNLKVASSQILKSIYPCLSMCSEHSIQTICCGFWGPQCKKIDLQLDIPFTVLESADRQRNSLTACATGWIEHRARSSRREEWNYRNQWQRETWCNQKKEPHGMMEASSKCFDAVQYGQLLFQIIKEQKELFWISSPWCATDPTGCADWNHCCCCQGFGDRSKDLSNKEQQDIQNLSEKFYAAVEYSAKGIRVWMKLRPVYYLLTQLTFSLSDALIPPKSLRRASLCKIARSQGQAKIVIKLRFLSLPSCEMALCSTCPF